MNPPSNKAPISELEPLRAGERAGAQRLQLVCGDQFPPEIFELADSLEILDLSGSGLDRLPDDLPRLHRLRVIFCSDCHFTELPEVLGACPQLSMVGFKANRIRRVSARALPPRLRWLILTDNELEALPPEIGRCAELQKLMLAGNRLRSLPAELADCQRLELLRIAANQLTELPTWLAAMPRLSWLAYAGNPLCAELERAPAGQSLAWDRLQLQQQLGEGASGVIYRALAESAGPVAVKLFKGAVTSDGLPRCEMAACLTAGAHPNLIPVLGQINGHPEGREGLVMSLIDPVFTNLAGPPSLASCTRDVYAPQTRFDLGSTRRLALGIASAARQLHARGLMHGDLYAHNILHDGQGGALLGDFGAASFYAPGDSALERLEVRAFGCLLEELIACCDGEIPAALPALAQACLDEQPPRRPLFTEIERALGAAR